VTEADWTTILRAFFLDGYVNGEHADIALACACIQAGMLDDQAVAMMRALLSVARDMERVRYFLSALASEPRGSA
jgi:hypothetical protein